MMKKMNKPVLKAGRRSMKILNELHPDLRLVFLAYFGLKGVGVTDISLICGKRDDNEQKIMFEQGLSDCDGVTKKSKHQPDKDGYSRACDFQVYNADKDLKNKVRYDYSHLSRVAGTLQTISFMLYAQGKIAHVIRWGGDWDNDGTVIYDQRLQDLCHVELILPNW